MEGQRVSKVLVVLSIRSKPSFLALLPKEVAGTGKQSSSAGVNTTVFTLLMAYTMGERRTKPLNPEMAFLNCW